MGRLRAKGGESQTERWAGDGTGRWGVCHMGEAGVEVEAHQADKVQCPLS